MKNYTDEELEKQFKKILYFYKTLFLYKIVIIFLNMI